MSDFTSSFLSGNLQFLRRDKGLSQQALAAALGIPRTTLAGYETGRAEPGILMLRSIAVYFGISLDSLISSDMRVSGQVDIAGTRILAITVDTLSRENIELVESRAAAGYLESFQQPEYLQDLPKMRIPGLDAGPYRAFEIEGDSMLPVVSGSIVIGSYVSTLGDVVDNNTYIVISKRAGIVYKRLIHDRPAAVFRALSDNPVYAEFSIPYDEVGEIWRYRAHIAFSDTPFGRDDFLAHRIGHLEEKIDQLTRGLKA